MYINIKLDGCETACSWSELIKMGFNVWLNKIEQKG